ncbi:MAG: tetratricopeptide repeat protein [Stigonema ocellatum SAG 48.90 = DSM 106950]|nr:tetratricopeptide repeat protein [Stigonema ocellatum SAG 48.90 = DSM 106950]
MVGAKLYDSQGRYSEAEPLYIKALKVAERSLGVNHPNTIAIRKNKKDDLIRMLALINKN